MSPNVQHDSNHTSPVFFIDRNLGSDIVRQRLEEEKMEVEIHHDHFSNSERNDAHWLREVGQKGWIILTKDKSIGRNPIELKAIAEAEAKMFVLAANKNLRGEEIGDIFALSLEKLTRFAKTMKHRLLQRCIEVDP